MKRILPLLFVFTSFLIFAQSESQTYIPDDNFEQALIDRGYDDVLDDYVLTANIDTITELDISGINQLTQLSVTGIEDFTALTVLNCRNNIYLRDLNLSQLVNLEDLDVFGCYVGLDTSNNPELRRLIAGNRSPQSSSSPALDLSNNPKLEELLADTEVDLSNNPLLKKLVFWEYSVSSVDVTRNPELENLSLGYNREITEIDLSNNPKLTALNFTRSGLKTLDLSNNPMLVKVTGRQTVLEFLNIQNGNNGILEELSVDSPTCVQVDDVAYAEAQTNWSIGGGSYSENCSGTLTYVPDDVFEQALIDRGYDDVLDDYVLTANIDTITELDISGINQLTELSLTGIEDFIALKVLDCSNNPVLTALDIGTLVNLEDLNMFGIQVFSLDSSNNPELRRLITGYENLVGGPSLDLTSNSKLEVLRAGTEVDLSGNPLLKRLSFLDFSIASLDVSNNPELEYLSLGGGNRELKELDLSANIKLKQLNFSETGLTSLDLSNNPQLESVAGSIVPLKFLNLKNGNNETLSILNVEAECVQVEDVAYAEAQTNWSIGGGSYSENCSGILTYVPDDNFEQALIDRGYDDVLDNYVLTSNIDAITVLDISIGNPFANSNYVGVEDFTGIEAFISLKTLSLRNHVYVNSLDIDQLSFLEDLDILGCSVTSLDTSQNPELKRLITGFDNLEFGPVLNLSSNYKLEELLATGQVDVTNNTLLKKLTYLESSVTTTVDVSNNPELTHLTFLHYNFGLTELDLSNNPKLSNLSFTRSGLTSLDLSNNPMLERVSGHMTRIQFLNLQNGNNQGLIELDVPAGSDACFQVDNVAYAEAQTNWSIGGGSYSEDCSGGLTYVPDDNFEQALIDLGYDDVLDNYVSTSNLETIFELEVPAGIDDLTGLQDIINLGSLSLNGTFSTIDLSSMASLESLIISSENIESIDLSNNPELQALRIAGSSLQALDLSNNTKLTGLNFSGTAITKLDLSMNPLLREIVALNSSLQHLDLRNENNEALELLDVSADCVSVDDVDYAQSQPNWTIGGSYSTNCSENSSDEDNDGVIDSIDICPNTVVGEPVNALGCGVSQLADLAVQNISIGIGSDPCSETPSCYINIDVLKNVEINVAIVKNAIEPIFDGPVSGSNPLFLENLTEGEYRICASSPFIPGFEQCYDVSSSATKNSVNTVIAIQNSGQTYTLTAAGSKSYTVAVNDEIYTYDFDTIEAQQLTFPLEVGVNTITVTGELECTDRKSDLDDDGISAEEIEIEEFDKMMVYPTVTKGQFALTNPTEEAIATVSVSTLNGSTISVLPLGDSPKEINLNISGNAKGMYIVRVAKMSGEEEFIKIILD